MEKVNHRQISVGELKLHVAEAGSGPAVIFLHGFPEIWYSWRHQILAVASAGFRAIAPDFRGYGLSEQPQNPENAKMADLVDDIVALMDVLTIDQAFLVGKDFGAPIAYYIALLYPNRVKAVITLGVPYIRPTPGRLALESTPPGFYIRHWQQPGRAVADFARFDVKSVIRNIYTLFSGSNLPVADDGKEIMDLYDPSKPLPSWFSEEDLEIYSSLYEKSGFVYPVQVPYICMGIRDMGKLENVTDYTVKVPALLIMGTEDYSLKFPGIEEYTKSEILKSDVPQLEIQFFQDGSHFVQEQFPEEVNGQILTFLKKNL